MKLALTQAQENALTQHGALPLPYGDMPELTGVTSAADMRRLLTSLNPDAPPETIQRQVDRHWNIFGQLAIEDIIVVPYAHSNDASLAQVVKPYAYRTEGGDDIHVVEVQWVKTNIPRRKFGIANRIIKQANGLQLVEHMDDRKLIYRQLDRPYNRFASWLWLLKLIIGMNILVMLLRMIQNQ